jgi:hypothetical protein
LASLNGGSRQPPTTLKFQIRARCGSKHNLQHNIYYRAWLFSFLPINKNMMKILILLATLLLTQCMPYDSTIVEYPATSSKGEERKVKVTYQHRPYYVAPCYRYNYTGKIYLPPGKYNCYPYYRYRSPYISDQRWYCNCSTCQYWRR